MKICKKEDCEKELYAHGFCKPHYIKNKQFLNRGVKPCKFPNCKNGEFANQYCMSHNRFWVEERNEQLGKMCGYFKCKRGVYAKGMCRKHSSTLIYRKKNSVGRRRCEFPSCSAYLIIKTDGNKKYCYPHQLIVNRNEKHNLPIFTNNIPAGYFLRGDKNHNYTGKPSYYKNHGTLKRVRKFLIKFKNSTCDDCGKVTDKLTVHHLKEGKNYHHTDNLKLFCYKCHRKYHPTYPNRIKLNVFLIRALCIMKEINQKEIARLLGLNQTTIYARLRNNTWEKSDVGKLANLFSCKQEILCGNK